MAEPHELVQAATTAAGLDARYSQPHRCYHTLSHVTAVLSAVDELSPQPTDLLALQLAAWFHDAIYAPGRSDNEERSAFLAADTLELIGAPPALGTEVARLVRLTTNHLAPHGDNVGAVLCDADLSILGSTPAAYSSYAQAIRQEYQLVTDDVFINGRAIVLEQLLQRPALFQTVPGRSRWEAQARENMQLEISQLRRGDRELTP